MFKINDIVMHGGSEVCVVSDIRREKFSGKPEQYYILKPVYDSKATIYCPVESDKIKMRELLTRDEILNIINSIADDETEWVDNDQLRKEQYNEILRRGDQTELMRLIKVLWFNRVQKNKSGRKFHSADERILKEAESIVYGEFAYVLDIKPDEVVAFIAKTIDE